MSGLLLSCVCGSCELRSRRYEPEGCVDDGEGCSIVARLFVLPSIPSSPRASSVIGKAHAARLFVSLGVVRRGITACRTSAEDVATLSIFDRRFVSG